MKRERSKKSARLARRGREASPRDVAQPDSTERARTLRAGIFRQINVRLSKSDSEKLAHLVGDAQIEEANHRANATDIIRALIRREYDRKVARGGSRARGAAA
jgi:hypothetical protein